MKSIFTYIFLSLLLFNSCSSDESITNKPSEEETEETTLETEKFFYRAVDFSYYPRLITKGLTFYNRNYTPRHPLQILKENGVNTVRLRLWHTPVDEHASFAEVESFSSELKRLGFKVWLTVHYSDSWADPGKQVIPAAWQGKPFTVVKDSLYNYTAKIMTRMQPDMIQIGNEVDPGMLLPLGDINTQRTQFLAFLNAGIKAVRDNNNETKIMIHKADAASANHFFNIVKPLDFDIIGLSYYPKWHGKDLIALRNDMVTLDANFTQDILLAETSYPFTLDYNDQTNNVIGSNSEIIYPAYPATLAGQKAYLEKIKSIVKTLTKGVGFGYWGAEWVAFEGPIANGNGSVWENQSLFDFNLKATPALEVFRD